MCAQRGHSPNHRNVFETELRNCQGLGLEVVAEKMNSLKKSQEVCT